MKKPIFMYAGKRVGPPTLEDIIAISRKLTGREPTQEEIERAKATLARQKKD